MTRLLLRAALACLFVAAGCRWSDSPDHDACRRRSQTRVALTLYSAALSKDGKSRTLRGTARSRHGLAIRRVVIQGYPAESTTLGFLTWKLDLPVAELPTTQLTAEVEDVCGDIELRLTIPLPDAGNADDDAG